MCIFCFLLPLDLSGASAQTADIAYPEEIELLNDAREKLEKLTGGLCRENGMQCRKQLQYLRRGIGYIVNMVPDVRPIVCGKARAKTEFGAKLHISLVDGYERIERLSFEPYNGAGDFQNVNETITKHPRYGVVIDKGLL